MSRADLDRAVLDAADRLVALREAEQVAALESCQGSNATAHAGPTRGEVLAADRMLERAVLARRKAVAT